MDGKNWKYKIGIGLFDYIPSLIMLAVFGGVALLLRKSIGDAIIFLYLFAALGAALLIYTIYRHLFVKMYIDEHGFYIQTKPGNGKYYKISDIVEAWDSSGTGCFNFRTTDGDTVKFSYNAPQSDGIDYLMCLINGEDPDAPYVFSKLITYENGFLCIDDEDDERYFKLYEIESAEITEAEADKAEYLEFTTVSGSKFNAFFEPEQRQEIEAMLLVINKK
ncbi:MAG: hypothetical protein IJL87_04725 [Clostridia bacterium]|nr:hypothetical protein [Clostridia bacterium]